VKRILVILGILLTQATHAAVTSMEPPPFKQLRYDENYSYLRDSTRRADFLDPIKFIPLNANRSWYLTLGGEVRERYEY